MYDDELQQAAGDIALIRSVLERTTISFATLRPAIWERCSIGCCNSCRPPRCFCSVIS